MKPSITTSEGKHTTRREHVVFPSKVPVEVKSLVKVAPSLEKSFFRKLIKLALGFIDHSYNEEECETAFNNLCIMKQCNTEEEVMNLAVQYSGVITLLRSSLRAKANSIRQEVFVSDLVDIGLPEQFASDISKVVYGPNRDLIDDKISSTNPHFPTIDKMDWRVDVTISSSWISKVLEPVITMNITTDDGKETKFEVPISQFHELRYTTANLLNKMNNAQALPDK